MTSGNRDPDDDDAPRSPFDADPVAEQDLWFLPGPPEDAAPTDPPWPVAPREASLDPAVWRMAEASEYRALLDAAQAVARFGERLRAAPDGLAARLALMSVAATLRGEGLWLGPEQIALYRALRLGAGDAARDLARAAWGLRRLETGADPGEGLHGFLGRSDVHDPRAAPGDDRPVGADLDRVGRHWSAAVARLDDCHPLTGAGFGFALWRAEGITPWDELLEPTVAAQIVGAGDLAPFLPVADGTRFDRHRLNAGTAGARGRLVAFYAAAGAGALRAAMEIDRMTGWRDRALAAIADLSGRTPPRLVAALLRYPVLSAELAADAAGCSRPAARRNLNLFADRGLIREVTGQDRYRFWTAAA